MLTILALLPLVGGVVVWFLRGRTARYVGLAIALATFVLSIIVQLLPDTWRSDIVRFMPDAAGRVISATLPGQQDVHLWSTWPQFLVTGIWAAVFVGVGGYLFRKRDA